MHDSRRLHQRYGRFGATLLGVVVALVSVAAQTGTPGSVAVGGDVAKPFTLTLADLRAMPRTTLKLGNAQRPAVYEGVLLAEVLKRAGAPIGPELSGPAVASYVLATAADGYRALFALAEADPEFTNGEILIADTLDGKPLGEGQGPVRLVIPQDKRAARSVRMLQRIDVVQVKQ